jgi:hypothetical protein
MLVATMTANDTIDIIEIDGSLSSMQSLVGGLIQPIDLLEDVTMWVNEEGLLIDLPYNHLATTFCGIFGIDTYICGNVFLTGGTDEDGNTMPLKQEYADYLRAQMASVL